MVVQTPESSRVLVCGATGYIGGRLVPRLTAAGYHVRCLARDPRKLEGRAWTGVEVVRGDVLDRESLLRAAKGCEALYYLVHSMAAGEERFEEWDRMGAEHAAWAAAAAGVRRILYLGGLGKRETNLSAHLRSRNEVGDILRRGLVPVTEFRAAMVIGSGSASFDIMHALVNRLPVMTAPRWVSTRSQPIAVGDVLRYLVEALRLPESAGLVIDIGGPDVISYREMMLHLARKLGLRRRIIVVPVLTPRLSSLWINLVTPMSAALARPLIEGLKTEMVCESDLAIRLFPFTPMGVDEALDHALEKVRSYTVETKWSDASVGESVQEADLPADVQLLSGTQTVSVHASAASVFRVFSSIGGDTGWYYGTPLWRIRGFLDKMAGGVGLRRGRRHPTEILPGEALDFWRVESVVPGERIVLRAEMKVPGRAWLEFSVRPLEGGRALFTQTARFYPRGVLGLAYWYGIYPLHVLIFAGMAKAIARRSEAA